MRKCSTALIAFHLQYYFLDISLPLLSQSGAAAGEKNTHFHSPVSLDVPFQIADSRRVEETETGGTEHIHGREHCANFSNAHIQLHCTSLVITNINVKST